ncbi:MAG: hypothetical protein WC438_02745 [Candidatus Pacearchaeota archaeon]
MVLQGISKSGIGEKPGIALALSDNVDKLSPIKDSIHELNFLISQREKLSKEVFDEAEKVKIDINNFLVNVNKDMTNEDALKERQGLRQKVIEVAEFQLKEKVTCWQDVSKLKQELREKEQELAEKQSRLNMLNDILDDSDLKGGMR